MNHLCKFYCYLAYVNTLHVFQVGYDAASIIIRDTKNVLLKLVLKDKICKYNNCEKNQTSQTKNGEFQLQHFYLMFLNPNFWTSVFADELTMEATKTLSPRDTPKHPRTRLTSWSASDCDVLFFHSISLSLFFFFALSEYFVMQHITSFNYFNRLYCLRKF